MYGLSLLGCSAHMRVDARALKGSLRLCTFTRLGSVVDSLSAGDSVEELMREISGSEGTTGKVARYLNEYFNSTQALRASSG